MKAGNNCIYAIFAFLNIALLLLGLGIGAAAVYLWTITKNISAFTGSFLGLGVFIALIATCSFCLRGSTFRLSIYILILLILTLAQILGTVLFIVKREEFLDFAAKHIDDEESYDEAVKQLERNIDITRYILVGISALTLVILLFALFYRCSVASGRMEYKERMMKNDRYERMSQEIEKAHRNKEEKRKMYMDKY